MAKVHSWKEYGEILNSDYKDATKNFYKKIKVMRNSGEQYDPTDIINDENGNALNEPHMVLNRWRKYFEELLNLQCEGQPSNPTNTVTASKELEPCISLSEIRNAVKAAPVNKAPGSDNIAAELIKAAEETGYIDFLTKYGRNKKHH